ncbi:MAG: STAS domain-containing protein [Pseudomonadota bacterium]
MKAELILEQPDTSVVSGCIDFATVPDLWEQIATWLKTQTSATLSLRSVTQANSAALALLLEAMEVARQSSVTLYLADIPESVLTLARLSNIDTLLLNENQRKPHD